jgi:trimeric autotransporter adhesin
MRHGLVFAVVVLAGLAGTSGVAFAASGQAVCVGRPSQPMTAPNSHGKCKRGQTLVRFATQTQLTTLQAQNAALTGKVSSLQSANAGLNGEVSNLQSANTALAGEISALQTTLSKVSYNPQGVNGRPTLTLAGANLQIISGTGSTDGATNGLGNLIIGYDEKPGAQTGSHDIILGNEQTFTSYGGIIGGFDNALSGPFSAVFGAGNTASGLVSSVTGGESNKALVEGSSVTGGTSNTAGNTLSSVSGGWGNTANGLYSSIGGGFDNTTSASYTSILGGDTHTLSTIEGSEAGPTVFGP